MRKEFVDYVERMKKIRRLSTPAIDSIKSEYDYGKTLVDNFREIGEMAGENRETVEKILLPMIQSDKPLTEDEIKELSELRELLMVADTIHEIDQHIADMINERILDETASTPEDETSGSKEKIFNTPEERDNYINSLGRTMQIKYFRMITSQQSNPVGSEKCRKEGLVVVEKLKKYMEKDVFETLSAQMQQFVFKCALNGALMYQAYVGDNREYYRKKMMEALKCFVSYLEDDFYKSRFTEIFLKTCEVHAYDHMSAILLDTELPKDAAKEIFPYMLKMEDLLKNDPVVKEDGVPDSMIYGMEMTLFQCAALAGDSSTIERLKKALEIYEMRDPDDLTAQGAQYNQSYPLIIYECLANGKVREDGLTEEDYALLDRIVSNMIEYICKMPKESMLTDRVVVYNKLLNVFVEYPGKRSFGDFFIESIAAIHPPTYVHSKMVAKISLCLARHLIRKKPEVFVGFPGIKSAADLSGKSADVLNYAYNAALYHDMGKLSILDTISMYGRRLLDTEFSNIKCHPDNGYKTAVKYVSTRDYADVIRGHHKFYDNSSGYPTDFDTSKSPYKAIIDIVTIADCMDAATDGVGRSYNIGKTYDDYIKEVKAGANTRYAPYFAELLKDKDVYNDMQYILTEERNGVYREIYSLMKR